VLYRACLDLPSAACPTFHGVRQVYARMQGGPTLPDAMCYSLADRSAVMDENGIRIQELCMLAGMSAAAANSTAHDAIAVEAAMAWRSRSDARQPQQLSKCVDRPMAWVLKGAIGAQGYPGYLKLAVAHASRSALSTVRAQQSVAATTRQGSMVCTVCSSVMCPLCMCRTRMVQTELSS
jgi:hypothetical protein